MSTVEIVRTDAPMPSEAELVIIRRFLFECLRGVDDDNQKSWKRIWGRFVRLEAGEISFVEFIFPRNSKFHRKFFALLAVGYAAFEPKRKHKSYKGMLVEKNPDQFREDVIILAGHYIQTFDIDGRMKTKAKSIKFSSMDDVEFSKVYESVLTVILNKVCIHYKDRAELDAVVERIIGFA